MKSYVDLDQLGSKVDEVLALARRKGAGTAVAEVHQETNFNIDFRKGEIENLSEAESNGVQLTVTKDGQRATVSSCDLNPVELERMVDQALAICRYTDKDPFYTLPEEELLARDWENLDLFDDGLLDFPIKDKVALIRDLEEKFQARDARLVSDGSSLATIVGAFAIGNSLGFRAADTRGNIRIGVSGVAKDVVVDGDPNSGRKQLGTWTSQARHIEDLENLDFIADMAAKNVLRKLGARKPKTGRYPIYFEPHTARSLWGHLISAIKGTNIFRNESYLVGRLGTRVCGPEIRIVDDPTIIRGLRSRPFDSEGVACRRRVLVDDGMLESYLMGTYSANKLNMHSTGHAGGSTNVLIQPGELSEAEMIRQMGTGVWITSLLGAGTNISTGDYSRGALGLWVENGEVAYPIMEFTLNSNLDRMYQNIVLLGKDVYTGATLQTPGLVIDDITISGA